MHVRILGSAAGGGFPQWNCGCPNCHAVREGTFAGKPRTQAQVAVSADRDSWFLLGASPDLRAQIDGCTDLHPRSVRDSPVAGLVLASADLDHVLGLLLLREIQPLSLYGTASVLNILRQDNSMFGVLNRVPRQVVWNSLASCQPVRLRLTSGEDAGISCEAVSLAGQYPVYAQASAEVPREEAVSGLILTFDSVGLWLISQTRRISIWIRGTFAECRFLAVRRNFLEQRGTRSTRSGNSRRSAMTVV
jgi:pyrroloquinoline quinone biosynthesis protein B